MNAADLSVLFSDSGVSATADGTTANGNLDQPSDVLIGGEVLSTDYEFTCKADDFGGLVYGDSTKFRENPRNKFEETRDAAFDI